eukprot:TRINITY_DN12788_c0_g1_i1.p1 TRINITY_DN12788_c0_g1~~TRINITY_DN12788_c0_g1_i1.p1  ORF type:complete len:135 (+),score=22.08 TRINITY_DN12788_c0_g1_i1:955-1359(+)
MVKDASEYLYGSFMKYGVRVYEMYGRTLHAKTVTTDGENSMVGSYNLDYWSAGSNLETNVVITRDKKTATELDVQFELDLLLCKEVTLTSLKARSIWRRCWCWLSYAVMWLARPNSPLFFILPIKSQQQRLSND